jgi:hypothetical protein
MIYVYGFLSRPSTAVPPSGVAGEPVQFLRRGPILVAAGEVPVAPAPDLPVLRRHDAVVRALAGPAAAILPARFGSLCATDDDLGRWLKDRLSLLEEGLRLVEGCEQMTVRTFRPRSDGAGPATSPVGDAEEAASARLDTGCGPGTRYLTGKRRLQTPLPAEIDSLRRSIQPLVRAERITTHDDPPLIATLHHLVPCNHGSEYRQAVAAAADTVAPFRVVVTGPWAPYAFAPEGLA